MLKPIAAALLLSLFASVPSFQPERDGAIPVSLIVETDSRDIVQGEPFEFVVKLQNDTKEAVNVRANVHPHGGDLKFYVSSDGENYKRFVSPGIRSMEGGRSLLKLDTGDSVGGPVKLFWNDKPKLTNLAPSAVDKISRDRILTSFVFPEPGKYFVRAELFNVAINGGAGVTLTSKAVEVRVSQPSGEDLLVWEKIKDRPDIAFFLQEGWFRKVSASDRNLLEDELASLVVTYPSSRIARKVGKSLQRFKEKQSP